MTFTRRSDFTLDDFITGIVLAGFLLPLAIALWRWAL